MQLTALKAGIPGCRDRADALLKRVFFRPAEIPCTNGFPRGVNLSELRQGLLFTKIRSAKENKQKKQKEQTKEHKAEGFQKGGNQKWQTG